MTQTDDNLGADEMAPDELYQNLGLSVAVQLVDVREPEEHAQGHLPNARLLPLSQIQNALSVLKDFNQHYVLYCASGKRSRQALQNLRDLGYTHLHSLAGGLQAWLKNGFPVSPTGLTPREQARYARHLSLKAVGIDGQKKLLAAKILLVGLGGLGCPAALYLAAAGVGQLGLIDPDTVDLSNLQRQVLYLEQDIGHRKVDAAKVHLTARTPDLQIQTFPVRLDANNALDVIGKYDIVVNGCDNFSTRYLVNDACFFLQKPLIDGSVSQFEGRVSVYHPAAGGPCYRCLYPSPPPANQAPNCAEAGVLGVLPGLIGTQQATEAIKCLLQIGQNLVGRLWLYDALSQTVKILKTTRNPHCALCGKKPTIRSLLAEADICANARSGM